MKKATAKKMKRKPRAALLAVQTAAPVTALAVVPKQALVVPHPQRKFNDEEITLIKQTVARGTTDLELQFFLAVAKERNLSPLTRQIHAVKRNQWDPETRTRKEVMTIQTGIDGYRAIADRTGRYAPSDKQPLVEGENSEDLRITVWIKKFVKGMWHEVPATAYYREFVQTFKNDDGKYIPTSMWKKMPLNQLTKCAEALALRKAFPEELGALYTNEEMEHMDPYQPTPESPQPSGRTAKELGTLQPSQQVNRGHGNEGLTQPATAPAQATVAPAGDLIDETQRKRLWAEATRAGKSEDEVKKIYQVLGFEHSNLITKDKYKQILKEVGAVKRNASSKTVGDPFLVRGTLREAIKRTHKKHGEFLELKVGDVERNDGVTYYFWDAEKYSIVLNSVGLQIQFMNLKVQGKSDELQGKVVRLLQVGDHEWDVDSGLPVMRSDADKQRRKQAEQEYEDEPGLPLGDWK